MTSGRKEPRRKPAGAPADWEERRPAGAPEETADSGQQTPGGESGVRGPQSAEAAPADAAEDESAQAVDADLAALLDDARRERDEYLELARRARADFENYRKRAAQQAADAERRAKASLARDLLPAIDNLERALESAPADDPLADGVRLVHRELSDALARAGVESFDPTGEKFDPTWAEALSSQAADGAEPGTVLHTLARGYRLDGQLVRPARVVVAE
jgi:molecular chaperone GrpE